MAIITKIRIKNFKKFSNFELIPNEHMNLIVGDNETGKSTLLEAISLVITGTQKKQESVNLRNVFNADAVLKFLSGDQNYGELPILEVDLYFEGLIDPTFNGDNNIDKNRNSYGIRMVARPNPDYISEINSIIGVGNTIFPFDFYEIKFSTFADLSYFMNKDKPRCVVVDASKMSNSYSTDEYIKAIFHKYTDIDKKLRTKLLSEFNQTNECFANEKLGPLVIDENTKFSIKNSTAEEFENHLSIIVDDVSVANKGTGQQIIIKTKMALQKINHNIDVVLIEEPENHLSAINLRKIISEIEHSQDEQLFIATHSGYICSRLSLNNVFILGLNSNTAVSLNKIHPDTAKYFIKAPSVGLLDFSLSKKTILVEGPSEYMLFEKLYKSLTGVIPEDDGINVIATRGLSFRRYMELANLLQNRVAIITDNDGDYDKCIDRYKDLESENVRVFTCSNNSENTFEVVLYNANKSAIDSIITEKDDVLSYMLKNKTESAYLLLEDDINLFVPSYIKEAIEWVRK